jgi:3-hydroxyacyl-CoA dehydrogenase / enoyl-CoA hydratase / 3-hydroxybutyryl-CoA epimerase
MIKKVAVIGAGVMGCGIAAQIANNDVEVLLYDLEKDGALIAAKALKKQIEAKNSQFVHSSKADFVSPKSLKTDLHDTASCDLIIEAIVENLEIKKNLYQDLAKFMKKDAIIASNTSTFCLGDLKKDLPLELANQICIAHFFNPPRFMRLLELVLGDLPKQNEDSLVDFLENITGKDVIFCRDTPGFIANRIGCYLMELVLSESVDSGYKIEDIDYIFTRFLHLPSTGIFGLYDLIGLDVMKYISGSLKNSLHSEDDFQKLTTENNILESLIKQGKMGRKSNSGFYRLDIDENRKKTKYSMDLKSLEYKILTNSDIEFSDLNEFLNSNSNFSNFIKKILDRFFDYVISITNDISGDLYDIDKAMQLGFAFKYGPYELIQKYNLRVIPGLDKNKFGISPNSLQRYVSLNNITILEKGSDFTIYKLNEEKICISFSTKMNVLSKDVFSGLIKATALSEKTKSTLVIYSDYNNFSAGADLKLFKKLIDENNLKEVEEYLILGQKACMALKICSQPVVSVARGVALGGGCEILLHSDFIIAHQELSAGLVESSIGLIPGWGGLKESVFRGSKNAISNIVNGYKSTSAKDFAENYEIANIKILANTNKIFEYALKESFVKLNRKDATSVNLDINSEKLSVHQHKILSYLKENIDVISSEKLLDVERKIFLELIKTDFAKEKIAGVVR